MKIEVLEMVGGEVTMTVEGWRERILAALSMLFLGTLYGRLGKATFTNITVNQKFEGPEIKQ